MKRRVVVTGLGAVTPLGVNVASSWERVLAGHSGIALITEFDTTHHATKFAGLIPNFDPVALGLTPVEVRRMDPFIQYGLIAGKQAFGDSGLIVTETNAERIGCIIGSGIGGLEFIENNSHLLKAEGPKRISPFFIPGSIINMVSGYLSMEYGLKGPNLAVATACTTGTHAIGLALRTIQMGDADVILAGGTEKASTPLGIAGFCSARALSTRNDEPTRASRPFDKERDGFVLGDGAAVLVLEEYEHAKQRGARIYCEITGFGMSADAYHITKPSGVGAVQSMQQAMKDAKLRPEQIDYINAHGTATPIGDQAETEAMKAALGEHAHKVAVSSTKSMTGHLLGAAGAIEAMFSVLAIVNQVAPPTINLDNPDPACDLDYVPHTARPMVIQHCLSNSFGFGGTNGTLAFAKI